MDSNITIPDFMFCKAHGSEYCSKCYCDHRMCNNIQIEKELAEAFPDLTEEELLDRAPITNAFSFGAIKANDSGGVDGYPQYQCTAHHNIDCGQCFDWGKLAIAKAKLAFQNEDSITIDASREDKLKILLSMGIDLTMTKLHDDLIDKKLRSAINCSQQITAVLGNNPLDPSQFSEWTPNSGSLYEAIRTANLEEAFQHMKARAEGRENAVDLFVNPFMDLRQTLMSLTTCWDSGRYVSLIQDEAQDNAICVRIVEVRRLSGDVPCLVLLYSRGTSTTPNLAQVEWVQVQLQRDKSLAQTKATPEEQTLLLTLLAMNSNRLAAGFRTKRDSTEKEFKLSFLLPVGPLSQQDIGKLTNHTGCAVCGNKTASKCSACLSVEYCGPVCQREDWKLHKPTCSSLRGGSWQKVRIDITDPEDQHQVMTYISNKATTMTPDGYKLVQKTDGPPANIHGTKAFIIKIQRPMLKEGSLLIYDMMRSINVSLSRQTDMKGWTKAMSEMQTGPKGLKIYRWAKRIGDLELEICFDKAPLTNPQW